MPFMMESNLFDGRDFDRSEYFIILDRRTFESSSQGRLKRVGYSKLQSLYKHIRSLYVGDDFAGGSKILTPFVTLDLRLLKIRLSDHFSFRSPLDDLT